MQAVLLLLSVAIALLRIVSKLSKRISSQEFSQRRLETELDDMRRSHSNLLRQHESVVADQELKMSVQEHLRIMDECRR